MTIPSKGRQPLAGLSPPSWLHFWPSGDGSLVHQACWSRSTHSALGETALIYDPKTFLRRLFPIFSELSFFVLIFKIGRISSFKSATSFVIVDVSGWFFRKGHGESRLKRSQAAAPCTGCDVFDHRSGSNISSRRFGCWKNFIGSSDW